MDTNQPVVKRLRQETKVPLWSVHDWIRVGGYCRDGQGVGED